MDMPMTRDKTQQQTPDSGSVDRRRFLAAAGLASALAPARVAEAQTESAFVPLMDGRTLAGWVIEEGPESSFHVDNGAIVAHESACSPTFIFLYNPLSSGRYPIWFISFSSICRPEK